MFEPVQAFCHPLVIPLRIENIYEAESTEAFHCVDILFTHPVSISVTKDELVQNVLYLVADCRSVGVKDSEEINKLGQ